MCTKPDFQRISKSPCWAAFQQRRSGLILLAFSVWYFYRIRISSNEIWRFANICPYSLIWFTAKCGAIPRSLGLNSLVPRRCLLGWHSMGYVDILQRNTCSSHTPEKLETKIGCRFRRFVLCTLRNPNNLYIVLVTTRACSRSLGLFCHWILISVNLVSIFFSSFLA